MRLELPYWPGRHPSVHVTLPPSDGCDRNRHEGLQEVLFEGVIRVLTKILLHRAPEELNKIEFTVELRNFSWDALQLRHLPLPFANILASWHDRLGPVVGKE